MDEAPRMVVGYEKLLPLYGDFNNDENIPDFFNMGQRKQSLQLILDVILQQIMKNEKENDFTAKVVLNCCLNYPTRYEHGYSGKEIVAITEFLQKSIQYMPSEKYYNSQFGYISQFIGNF